MDEVPVLLSIKSLEQLLHDAEMVIAGDITPYMEGVIKQ
jgi:hypothetical protein